MVEWRLCKLTLLSVESVAHLTERWEGTDMARLSRSAVMESSPAIR